MKIYYSDDIVYALVLNTEVSNVSTIETINLNKNSDNFIQRYMSLVKFLNQSYHQTRLTETNMKVIIQSSVYYISLCCELIQADNLEQKSNLSNWFQYGVQIHFNRSLL